MGHVFIACRNICSVRDELSTRAVVQNLWQVLAPFAPISNLLSLLRAKSPKSEENAERTKLEKPKINM